MASFEQLYSVAAAAGGDNAATEFEARRMAEMAEFIARRWPGTDDADAAFSVLVSYAIRNDRIEEAEKLLGSASERSRPRLELQLGNAMWGRYLELRGPTVVSSSGRRLAQQAQTIGRRIPAQWIRGLARRRQRQRHPGSSRVCISCRPC